MTDNIRSKAKEKAAELTEKISDLTGDIFSGDETDIKEEFKETGREKLKSVLENINNSSAIIQKSGFELKGLGVELSITPVIITSFGFEKKISEEERKALLKEVSDKRLLKIIFHTLFKANDFFDAIKFSDYKLDTVNITLGLTPGVDMTFKK